MFKKDWWIDNLKMLINILNVFKKCINVLHYQKFTMIYLEVIAPAVLSLIYKIVIDVFNLLPLKSHKFANFTTPEFIRYYDYPCEEHTVITKDGYILTMFRIPRGRKQPVLRTKTPILLTHGVFGSSSMYVMKGYEQSIGFILADYGFDVWLGNFRGTSYSNQHKNLDNRTVKYWTFSLKELGTFDIPAMVDYVLKTTRAKQTILLGFSLGFMTSMAMFSRLPDYNKKVSCMIGMGPVCYIKNLGSLAGFLLDILPKGLENFAKIIGWQEIFRRNVVTAKLANNYCREGQLFEPLLRKFIFSNAGANDAEHCKETALFTFGQAPEASSLKFFANAAQIKASGRFADYDYGKMENLKVYGQELPPLFNLQNVTVPMHLIWGKNDKFTHIENLQRLRKEIPNIVSFTAVDDENWSHIDFVFGKNAAKKVYNLVIDIAQCYK